MALFTLDVFAIMFFMASESTRGQMAEYIAAWGVDKPFVGFSFHGKFNSAPRDQVDAKNNFLKEYGSEVIQSASEALHNWAAQASADGPPAEYAVPLPPKPPPPPEEDEEEPPPIEEESPES